MNHLKFVSLKHPGSYPSLEAFRAGYRRRVLAAVFCSILSTATGISCSQTNCSGEEKKRRKQAQRGNKNLPPNPKDSPFINAPAFWFCSKRDVPWLREEVHLLISCITLFGMPTGKWVPWVELEGSVHLVCLVSIAWQSIAAFLSGITWGISEAFLILFAESCSRQHHFFLNSPSKWKPQSILFQFNYLLCWILFREMSSKLMPAIWKQRQAPGRHSDVRRNRKCTHSGRDSGSVIAR